MDRNNNGDLTASEFRRGLKSLTGTQLSPAQLDDLMYEVDQDGDGHVDYREFIAAFRRTDHARRLAQEVTSELRRSIDDKREDLLRAFSAMDANRDGLLTAREFQRGLSERGIKLGASEMKQLMRVVDQDGDEMLDYVEFMHALETDYTSSADSYDSEYETWSSTRRPKKREPASDRWRDRRRRGQDDKEMVRTESWRNSPTFRNRRNTRRSRHSPRTRVRSGSPRFNGFPRDDFRDMWPSPRSEDAGWVGRASHINV